MKIDTDQKALLDASVHATGKTVSLKMLAAHLGLSITAVSRVLNRTPAAKSIPEKTQRRILEAARQFNYQPNIFARSLRNRRSSTIGVMVPEVSEGYATSVLSGIEQQLLQEDYFYLVVSHHHRKELIEKYEHLLLARSIEGLIAVDTLLPRRLSVPTVTVSGHHEPEGVTNIMLNHSKAATLALEHLSSLGHSRIAFIKGQEFSSDTAARWRAIQAAADKLLLKISPQLIMQLEGDRPTHEPGYFATQKLLAAGGKFTALFSFNDISAIGAIRALREAGLRVPEDVSVVGFDDVQSAAYQNPALTTVRQPLQKMGALAAQTVLQLIKDPATVDNGSPHANRLMVDPELIVRGSTAAPAQGASRKRTSR
ncbi:MAG: LacI family DNA-binding transcriptional regulator [Acidobacteriaceae bacterium]